MSRAATTTIGRLAHPAVRPAVSVGAGRVVVDSLGFLESPRWYDGVLWFSDFASRWVSSVDASGALTRRLYIAGQPSGLALAGDGSVLVASMHDGRVLRGRADGTREVVADLGVIYRGSLGDMAVSPEGRIYVSTLPDLTSHDAGSAPRCPILFIDIDGSARVAAEALRIPNGMIVTRDGRSLIVAETQGCRLLRFPIAADGSLGVPTVFADCNGRKPDGICLDPCGAVWTCCPFTSEFLLVAEGGEVLASGATPGSWAVACCIGDASASKLYVLTAQVTLDDFRRGGGSGAVRVFDLERR